jgi:hypothetical protein
VRAACTLADVLVANGDDAIASSEVTGPGGAVVAAGGSAAHGDAWASNVILLACGGVCLLIVDTTTAAVVQTALCNAARVYRRYAIATLVVVGAAGIVALEVVRAITES